MNMTTDSSFVFCVLLIIRFFSPTYNPLENCKLI